MRNVLTRIREWTLIMFLSVNGMCASVTIICYGLLHKTSFWIDESIIFKNMWERLILWDIGFVLILAILTIILKKTKIKNKENKEDVENE